MSAEYLVAMKLMAGRQYKNDLSDIVGILIEQEERNEPLTFDSIQKAIIDLYDSYDKIPEDSRNFIEAVYNKEDLRAFYKQCRELEQENKDVLVGFQEDYPDVLNGDNLADILKSAKAKKATINTKKMSRALIYSGRMPTEISISHVAQTKRRLTQ